MWHLIYDKDYDDHLASSSDFMTFLTIHDHFAFLTIHDLLTSTLLLDDSAENELIYRWCCTEQCYWSCIIKCKQSYFNTTEVAVTDAFFKFIESNAVNVSDSSIFIQAVNNK